MVPLQMGHLVTYPYLVTALPSQNRFTDKAKYLYFFHQMSLFPCHKKHAQIVSYQAIMQIIVSYTKIAEV